MGRLALRASQAVIPINSRVESEVEALCPGKVVPMIPNGVDPALYRPATRSESHAIRTELAWDERPRLLFVGRVGRHKGADLAIEVAAAVAGEAELVLVGPGDPGPLPENATALGAMLPADVGRLYQAADCLLVPSRAEGFPLVLQEAMATGLPSLIADDASYAAQLAEAPEGVVRAPRRVDAMVDALRSASFGRAFTSAQRSALAAFAAARFSWAESAAQHEALYRELLARVESTRLS